MFKVFVFVLFLFPQFLDAQFLNENSTTIDDIEYYMATDYETYTFGDTVNIIYRITNNSLSQITFIFPTTQIYDFLVSQNGITIWRWSLGYVFGQYMRFITLNPGNSTEANSSWSNPTTSGYYEVTGFYTYENFINVPVSVSIEFLPVDVNDFEIQNFKCEIFNYPNPFNPSTTIEFSIQNNSKIDLSIFNNKGQKIKSLINKQCLKGKHSIIWHGVDDSNNSVSSGMYYYKLKVNNRTKVIKKCLLLK
jgi:Intracellular proteinase inhibitor/FlgD Ig-like domain